MPPLPQPLAPRPAPRRLADAAANVALPAPTTPEQLATACRHAVEMWRGTLGVVARATASAAVRLVQRYAARPGRTPRRDGHLLLRSMRSKTWFQLAQLQTVRSLKEFGPMRPGRKPARQEQPPHADLERRVARVAMAQWRRTFTSDTVRSLIKFLSGHALDNGQIPNGGHMIAAYAVWAGISRRAAYRHLAVLRDELGIVRETRAPAGHRSPSPEGFSTTCSRYTLCWPARLLPHKLPEAADTHGGQDLAPSVMSWDEDALWALARADDFPQYAYGSCTYAPTPATTGQEAPSGNPVDNPESLSAYYCQAIPLYARVSPPSPRRSCSRRGNRPGPRRGGITDDDLRAAAAILEQCRSPWADQGQQFPDDAGRVQLIGLIALASRYKAHLDTADLVEILTQQTESVQDLVAVTRYRLQQLLRAFRARNSLPVDETGHLYTVKVGGWLQEAALLWEETAPQRAAVRQALISAQERVEQRQARIERDRALRHQTWLAQQRLRPLEDESRLRAEVDRHRLLVEPVGPSAAELAALRRARMARRLLA